MSQRDRSGTGRRADGRGARPTTRASARPVPTVEKGPALDRLAIASGGPRPDRGRAYALLAALVLVATLVAAAHGPVLRARALSFDDRVYVTDNPLVTHPGWTSAAHFFGEVLRPTTVRSYYHPLAMLSLMLDYAMGGRPDDPRAFHRTSLALHVVNSALILLLLYRLFGALIPAALVALLFGLHPLTVEPVAWIGERKALLAAFFAFLSLLSYLRAARGNGRPWMAASVALYACALLSKPTAMTLPLLLVVLDWWPLRRLDRRTIVRTWPFFLLSLVFGAITLASQHLGGGIAPQTHADLLQWPLHVGYLLAFYLTKIIRPADLSCAYLPPAPFALSNPVVLLSVAATCLVTVLVVLPARRARGPLAGWLFFALALAPTLGFVTYSWMIAADKYVYFPALGILLVVAHGLSIAWDSRWARGPARKVLLLAPLLLIPGAEWRGVRTALGNWTDTLTLARHMERLAPDSPVVQHFLGVCLETTSATDEALQHLRRSVALAPDYSAGQYDLGVGLARRGRVEESIPHLRTAVRLKPDNPTAAYALGNSLRLAGRLDEAEAEFLRVLRLEPGSLGALDQLGTMLLFEGRAQESVEHFRRAVALAPANAILRFRLAQALMTLGGHPAEAADHLRQVIRAKPDSPQPIIALAWLLATTPDPAVRDTGEALRLAGLAVERADDRDLRALDVLAAAQASAGHFDQAVQTARSAIRLALQYHAADVAEEIRGRLARYERGIAYVEAPPAGPTPAP